MAHLGTRISALLDGQLSPEEAERAWEHVHAVTSAATQWSARGG